MTDNIGGNQKRPTVSDDESVSDANDIPLCVDLDGTIVRTDTLIEAVIVLLKGNLLYLLLFPLWLLKGRAYFKRKISTQVDLRVERLPYNQCVLKYIAEQRDLGRKIVLATGADIGVAEKVAQLLGRFDEVLGSDGTNNMSGSRKAQELVARFGVGAFDYIGNEKKDLAIWRRARRGVVVSGSHRLVNKVKKICAVEKVINVHTVKASDIGRAVRVHQWVKNLLVFIPVLAAHKWNDVVLIGDAMLGFFAFCLCSSSVYLLNDLVDLESDRAHPRKRSRPLASGYISLGTAIIGAIVLGSGGIVIAATNSQTLLKVLFVYLMITGSYSLVLKKVILIDVVILAGLYTWRVVAGGVATGIVLSFWLLGFSMFVFFSLAMMKRCAELVLLNESGTTKASGRDYRIQDLGALNAMGVASGFLAILVLALYINSSAVAKLYKIPEGLWLLCPVLLYWLGRMWIKVGRGEMTDDPLVFALTDRTSIFAIACAAGIVAFST